MGVLFGKVPLVVVTSLRRKLSVTAALGLLLIPGCRASEEILPYAEAIRTPVEDFSGLPVSSSTVESEHSTVFYRYPRLGQSHPLTVEIRTIMAQRQTTFLEDLPEEGTPELHQDMDFLAVSPEVVGARITADSPDDFGDEFGVETLWYDAASETVLPWTALFTDENALEEVHLAVADVLENEYDMSLEQLPGLVGEVALRNQEETEEQEGSADDEQSDRGGPLDLSDPEQAQQAAEQWADSPLADLAFSTDGGLAVRMNPEDVPDADPANELTLPVEPENLEEFLSTFGYRARDAAVSNDPSDLPDEELTEHGVTLDCERLKCVALTFDDGPGEHTDRLLEMLADYDAHATFYVLGSLVEEYPDVLERMHTQGHELGNHTWKHDDLAGMSAKEIREDIERTNDSVSQIIGVEPSTIRPPYGSSNDTVHETVDQPLILWDVDTMDWQNRDSEAVAEHAIDNTAPGSVLLFHDIHGSTVDAIPDVLEELHNSGYHFVTVADLFGFNELDAGETYTDARVD